VCSFYTGGKMQKIIFIFIAVFVLSCASTTKSPKFYAEVGDDGNKNYEFSIEKGFQFTVGYAFFTFYKNPYDDKFNSKCYVKPGSVIEVEKVGVLTTLNNRQVVLSKVLDVENARTLLLLKPAACVKNTLIISYTENFVEIVVDSIRFQERLEQDKNIEEIGKRLDTK
jgi:hypothetical protein